MQQLQLVIWSCISAGILEWNLIDALSQDASATAGDLKRHQLRHSGVKPHRCIEPGCEYATTTSSQLKAHQRRHSGVKHHRCIEPGCEYAATTTGQLKVHQRRHSWEKPHRSIEPGCEALRRIRVTKVANTIQALLILCMYMYKHIIVIYILHWVFSTCTFLRSALYPLPPPCLHLLLLPVLTCRPPPPLLHSSCALCVILQEITSSRKHYCEYTSGVKTVAV